MPVSRAACYILLLFLSDELSALEKPPIKWSNLRYPKQDHRLEAFRISGEDFSRKNKRLCSYFPLEPLLPHFQANSGLMGCSILPKLSVPNVLGVLCEANHPLISSSSMCVSALQSLTAPCHMNS